MHKNRLSNDNLMKPQKWLLLDGTYFFFITASNGWGLNHLIELF